MESQGSSLVARIKWPAAWRGFAAFLRAPALPDRISGMGGASLRGTLQLLALDLLLMMPILIALVAMEKLGLELPTNALEDGIEEPFTIALIVIGAPVVEETIFRSWLSGKPAHLGIPLYVVLGLFGAGLASAPGGPLAGGLVGIAFVALIAFALWLGRKGEPAGFFARNFKWFYIGSALAFASIHIFNYSDGALWLLALLVIPQFIGGLLLGFARITYGLWSSMTMHALFNGILVALVLSFPEMG